MNFTTKSFRNASAICHPDAGKFMALTLNRVINSKFINSTVMHFDYDSGDNTNGWTILDLDGSTTKVVNFGEKMLI